MLNLLNRENIAPKGHMSLQKGRRVNNINTKNPARIPSLVKYIPPTKSRTGLLCGVRARKFGAFGFQIPHGTLASIAPQGHSFENQCSPVKYGIIKTRSIKDTYFR